MQIYLFNIWPKLHRRPEVTKITRRTVPNFLDHQQPVVAVVHPTFIRKFCYKLPTYQAMLPLHPYRLLMDQNTVFFTEWRHVDRQCEA